MAAQEVTEISCRHSMGELAEAVRGWDTINGWGLEDCALAAIAIWADCSSAGGTDGILDGWKNVKRGRDLRFPGWGPCKGFDKHVLKRLKLPRLLPTVRSIQLQMYGVDSSSSTVTRIQDEFGPEIQQWLIRWKDWWLADNNLMRLDEIGMCLVRDIPLMIGNPERVFAELDRQVLEEEEREDAGYTALPYAAKEVGVATPAGMLSTVTDDKALTQLGKDLHNCVGGYGEFCREEGRLIAVLTDDSGKAIACGEWSHGRWGQIVGSCNQLPTKVIRVAFDAHGRQLAMLAFNKNGESPDVMRLEGQVTNDQA